MEQEQEKPRSGRSNFIAAGFALAVYIIGGFGVMAGMGLIGIVGAADLWGWGEARSIGYLLFASGLTLSVLGVFIMRIMRNRKWA